MSEAVPETIDKATRAIPVVSQNFAVVVAVLALFGVALLVYRDEVRADAQIKVLESMAVGIREVKDEQREQRRAFLAAGVHVKVTPAVARDE